MASKAELIAFSSRDAMAARVADLVEASLLSTPSNEGRGELAVSGGSTPKAMYENLATRPLPWSKLRVTLVDERWVSIEHPRSNEAFVREAFGKADGAQILGLYTGASSPARGVEQSAQTLNARRRPFDAVILGMGDDGHTASWFPKAEGLDAALSGEKRVCAVTARKSDVTGEEVERMTLTLSAIKDARVIILMIAGASKRLAFEQALEDGPVEEMPVRAILRARPDLWVCWAP